MHNISSDGHTGFDRNNVKSSEDLVPHMGRDEIGQNFVDRLMGFGNTLQNLVDVKQLREQIRAMKLMLGDNSYLDEEKHLWMTKAKRDLIKNLHLNK
ncbi:hypothetical protein LXL04_023262 [Taraxacum kok-saghyz]